MRNFWKKSALALVITVIISMLIPTVVLADAVSCDILNDPAQSKDWVITILEEEIGGATSTADVSSPIIICFRETTCNVTKDSKTNEDVRTCTSTYKSDCVPGGNPGDSQTLCQRVQVILAKSGAALLYSYIGLIYRWAAGTIGVVSVLYMVWGGVQISAAGDNAGKIDEAKQKIFQSIAGLILLFLSAVILYTINPNFFTGG
jgi:hypothetical protein